MIRRSKARSYVQASFRLRNGFPYSGSRKSATHARPKRRLTHRAARWAEIGGEVDSTAQAGLRASVQPATETASAIYGIWSLWGSGCVSKAAGAVRAIRVVRGRSAAGAVCT